jgi:hypothetical protein
MKVLILLFIIFITSFIIIQINREHWCGLFMPKQNVGGSCTFSTDCKGVGGSSKIVCCKNGVNLKGGQVCQGKCTVPTIVKGIGWCPTTAAKQHLYSQDYIDKNKLCSIDTDCVKYGKAPGGNPYVCCTPNDEMDPPLLPAYSGKCVAPCMDNDIGWCKGTAAKKNLVCDGAGDSDSTSSFSVAGIEKDISNFGNTLTKWSENLKKTEVSVNNMINEIDIKPITF